MGLLFSVELDYEVPDVVWQPPITNDAFELKDGTKYEATFVKEEDGKYYFERKIRSATIVRDVDPSAIKSLKETVDLNAEFEKQFKAAGESIPELRRC